MVNKKIHQITERIRIRSQKMRDSYLHLMTQQTSDKPYRSQLSCGNLAHGFATCNSHDKKKLATEDSSNLGIVTAYNDMLSAHQPYASFPELIKQTAISIGATAQVAGGVPAMCDGVTQGRAGMELSLFSRDHIAMSTAIALSHDMFDGAIYLGICDKIVPGMLIGALSFGHLPGIFIPAGPMSTGISNQKKAQVRQEFARGKVSKQTLLKAESESYHSPGTCTFYGTANSNQMLMEIMGLQLPGSSFEHPQSPLREPLTSYAVKQLLKNISGQDINTRLCDIVDVKSIVNATVGLLATGGSTNHTIHLVAIAKAAGIILTWQDMAELSEIVPLLTRIYPNGSADVNDFHKAGGMRYLINHLLNDGLLHNDVVTVMGKGGLENYCLQPLPKKSTIIAKTKDTSGSSFANKTPNEIRYVATEIITSDNQVLRSTKSPFAKTGGLKLLSGNLGKAIIKSSAVASKHQKISAPAVVFQSQQALINAFEDQQLNRDFIAVIIFQGPRSNGMPELHKLTPILGSLQDQGYKVALVTDGRMSGASGKIPAAIHLTPEAINGGPISKIKNGDIIQLDCCANKLNLQVSDNELSQRTPVNKSDLSDQYGTGREMFSWMRTSVSSAEKGASSLYPPNEKSTPGVLI